VTSQTKEVTELLNQWVAGNQDAAERSFPSSTLNCAANQQDPNHTLQATALIQEAYLRLTGDSDRQWENRSHFFGAAAKAMRHVLVDYARAAAAAKLFGGLSVEETAGTLNISPETVARGWRAPKAWLHRELEKTNEAGDDI